MRRNIEPTTDNLIPEETLEAMRADYATGAFSLAAIGRKYGVAPGKVSGIARIRGWSRNLAAAVQAKAAELDTRPDLDAQPSPAVTLFGDEPAPQLRRKKKAGVGGKAAENPTEPKPAPSRARAGKAPDLSQDQRIEAAARAQILIVQQHRQRIGRLGRIVDELADALETALTARKNGQVAPFPGAEQPGVMLDSLTRALGKLIPLERQAFNIGEDAAGAGENSVEDRVRRFLEQQQAKAEQDAAARIAKAGPKVARLAGRRRKAEEGEDEQEDEPGRRVA